MRVDDNTIGTDIHLRLLVEQRVGLATSGDAMSAFEFDPHERVGEAVVVLGREGRPAHDDNFQTVLDERRQLRGGKRAKAR